MMRRTKQGLVSLLLILFTGYYCGITLFPHVHDIDGRRIVHSHPYSGTASQPGHQHTTQQLQLLQLLSLLTWISTALYWLRSPLRKYRQIEYAVTVSIPGSRHPQAYLLRGPPTW